MSIIFQSDEVAFVRWIWIDRFLEFESGKFAKSVKNVTLAEDHLHDHFPGFPVLPGVLMLEALIQSGAWLMRDAEDFRYSTILLKQAKALKFNSFVTPGRTLCVTATVHKSEDHEWTFKARGTVDDASAVSARLTLHQFNLADQDPSLADADQRTIDHMRDLFGQIWRPEAAVAEDPAESPETTV